MYTTLKSIRKRSMIMVKIDMEMPVSCIDCKLFRVYYENNEQEWSCGVVFKIINKIDEKPIWCPLIEVKE